MYGVKKELCSYSVTSTTPILLHEMVSNAHGSIIIFVYYQHRLRLRSFCEHFCLVNMLSLCILLFIYLRISYLYIILTKCDLFINSELFF
jgi:hypothetical protein